MIPIPVSAEKLCSLKLLTMDRALSAASIFPFFDQQGRVCWIMVLSPELPDINFLPYDPELFEVPFFGPPRMLANFTSLRPITKENLKIIKNLWHFDPWWMLDDASYFGHWAANTLKATNAVGKFQNNIKMLYFRRDLAKVTYVRIHNYENALIAIIEWKSAYLPDRPPEDALQEPISSVPSWSFDPIWKHWTASPRHS